jgi:ketosteroid isomerase-like protein
MSLKDEIARCYDALNRGDPNAFLDLYDPEIELFVPSWTGPDGGLYRGADAVNRWYAHNFAQWTEQHWEVVEALERGPNAVFTLHWTGKGKRSGVALAGQFVWLATFSGGKIVTIVHLGASEDRFEG